jgi:uridine kinase
VGAVETILQRFAATSGNVLGLTGPPGAGKSTLAHAIDAKVAGTTLILSLDDLYLSKVERARRGLAWRGPPGSHDLPLLIDVLDRLRSGALPVTVPRFDSRIDDRGPDETVTSRPDLVIVEGWFLGYPDEGYGEVTRRLGLLVFLDVPTAVAKQRRFERERQLRDAGGGFSEDQMERFWDEVLGPGIEKWTGPAKLAADLVISPDQPAPTGSGEG